MCCVCCAGVMLNDEMLNLMALRYGAATGHMTLESFISLILRLDCMHSKWSQVKKLMTITMGNTTTLTIPNNNTMCLLLVLLNRNLQTIVRWKKHESSWVRGNNTLWSFQQLIVLFFAHDRCKKKTHIFLSTALFFWQKRQ